MYILKEIVEFGERRCASDEELFATAYHKLVHSPALETMLQLEHMYSKTVRQKTEEKNALIKQLSDRFVFYLFFCICYSNHNF